MDYALYGLSRREAKYSLKESGIPDVVWNTLVYSSAFWYTLKSVHDINVFAYFVAPYSFKKDLHLCTFCNCELITSVSEFLKWILILFTHSERRKVNLALSSSFHIIKLLQYPTMKKLFSIFKLEIWYHL